MPAHFKQISARSCHALTLAGLLLLSPVLLADTLYMKSGEEIYGQFHKKEGDKYKFKTKNGNMLYIPQEDVKDLRIARDWPPPGTIFQVQSAGKASQANSEKRGNRGFGPFFRLHGGINRGAFTKQFEDDNIENEIFEGISPFNFGVQVGANLHESLALHGGISRTVANNASLGENIHSYDYTITAYTVGFSYYLPLDFYISPGYRFGGTAELKETYIGLPTSNLTTTYSGSGYQVSVGKESMISKKWSIGVGLVYSADTFKGDKFKAVNIDGSAIEGNYENKANSSHYGIVFSFIYR